MKNNIICLHFKLIFDSIRYPNAEKYRSTFNNLVNKCVNLELVDNYNLSAYSTIEYCEAKEGRQPLGELRSKIGKTFTQFFLFSDNLEIFTAVLIAGILVLVLSSSYYDDYLRTMSFSPADHYQNKLKPRKSRIFTIFSVKRNWKILSAPTKSDAKDLRFIEFIRTFGTLMSIYSHCILLGIYLPSSNPFFIDNVSRNF